MCKNVCFYSLLDFLDVTIDRNHHLKCLNITTCSLFHLIEQHKFGIIHHIQIKYKRYYTAATRYDFMFKIRQQQFISEHSDQVRLYFYLFFGFATQTKINIVVAWVSSEILWVHVELHHIPNICFMGILNMHLGSVMGQEKTQVH